MEFLRFFGEIGGVAREGKALEEMVAVTDVAVVERGHLPVTGHVNNEQTVAKLELFFLVLVFCLFLFMFLGFMIARRSNNGRFLLHNNGNIDADRQTDDESNQAQLLVVSQQQSQQQFEIEANTNPAAAQPSRHRTCSYTLENKCDFGTGLVCINFFLEIPSAVLDQIASEEKPTYVLMVMLFSFTSLLLCLVELVYKGKRQKITWKWRWNDYGAGRRRIPWFYHPPPSDDTPFGTFIEIIGFVCALAQSIVTTINYCFCIRDHASPIKIQVWPSVFAFGLLCCKLTGKRNEEDGESRASDQDVGNVELRNHPILEPYTAPELRL